MDKVKLIIFGLVFYLGLTQVSSVQIAPNTLISKEDYHRIMEFRSLAVEFMHHFGNFSQADLDLPNSRIPSQQDLQCLADMALLMNGVTSLNYWALKMIDAWGTFPKGLLYGNIMDMGNYDECIGINKAIADNYNIKGKYCFARVPFPIELVDVRIAICFPSSCSSDLMDTFFKQLFNRLLNVTVTKQIVNDDYCKTAEKEAFDGLTIFTIVLLSVLAAAMLLATLCDYFLFEDQSRLPGVIKAFSARSNSRALFRIVQPKSNPNVIDCLHGLRCMSLIWVIFSHQYILAVMAPNLNAVKMFPWIASPFASFILHGFFSVDTFLVISGLLLAMIALRLMEKTKGRLNIPMMYLHRYLRLTPVVAVAIIVHMTLIPILSDGPATDKAQFDNYDNCKSTWYLTLLYVQNYATPNMCVNHTWYLAADMQLYILSPIFLIALYKWGKKAAGGIFVLMLLLSGCLFATMMTGKYPVNLDKGNINGESQRKLYLATHVHAAPWLIGFLLGYFLHLNRNKSFQLNRISIWLGWIVSLAMLFASLFALYPAAQWSAEPLTMGEQAAYYTLSRIAWPLGICWVVFACMKGYGGLANSFLSSPLWQPLSKLSYTAYMFHTVMQQINARQVRTNTVFSDYDIMLYFWQAFGFTLLMSYVIYIIVEAPFGALEGMMMPQRKPKPKTEAPDETQTDKILVVEVQKTAEPHEHATSSEQQQIE
ncbi:nose resistant to fluoxetine protein 6-like isoform X1 [Drosophila sulfurigaster albostrigata]|uniref:nose resistant to fluoxetine protein 6-like isoform X1 n=1 Tax=Drosophila sulfurigaster albostrigata TaxID=89887 RepID=UPI002D2194CE|nr:nose resistant to fluoxetine protein 6-like isoform X1 [Drosophila sulfurigaster albostrigata]